MACVDRRQLRSVIRKHDLVRFKHLLKENQELLSCVVSDIHQDNLLSYCVRHGYLEEVEHLMNVIGSQPSSLKHKQSGNYSNDSCYMVVSHVYNTKTTESGYHDGCYRDLNSMRHDISKIASTNQTGCYGHYTKVHDSKSIQDATDQKHGSIHNITTCEKPVPILDSVSSNLKPVSVVDSVDRNHLTPLDIAIHGWLRVVHCSATEPKTSFARRYVIHRKLWAWGQQFYTTQGLGYTIIIFIENDNKSLFMSLISISCI